MASVVADWTGIPVGKMVRDQAAVVLDLEQHLGARIIGQDHALAVLGERIRAARAGLGNPNTPAGRVPAGRARRASARPRPAWRSPTSSSAASAS